MCIFEIPDIFPLSSIRREELGGVWVSSKNYFLKLFYMIILNYFLVFFNLKNHLKGYFFLLSFFLF